MPAKIKSFGIFGKCTAFAFVWFYQLEFSVLMHFIDNIVIDGKGDPKQHVTVK